MNDRADEDAGETSAGETSDDSAALRWEGEEELARMISRPKRRGATAARAVEGTESGEGVAAIEDSEDRDDNAADLSSLSSARRGVTVAAAIVDLLIAVGWVLSVQYTSSGSTSVVVDLPWQFGEFMAMVAAPLVFLAIRRITAERSLRRSVIGWLIGAVLLLPWPIVVLLARGTA